MPLKSLSLWSVCFCFVSFSLWAQDYDFSETIEVSKAYQPVFLDAKKIDKIPSLDREIQEKKLSVDYQLLSHPKVAKFSLPDIALRDYTYRDSVFSLENYLDLSMGNYLTPRASLQFSHLFSNNTLLGLSSQAQFSKYGGGTYDQKINSDFLNLSSQLFFAHTFSDKYLLRWDASHDMRIFHYYGLPADSLSRWADGDLLGRGINLEQRFHIFQTGITFKDQSSRENKWGVDRIAARFRWLKDNSLSLEKRADFESYYFISRYFGIGMDGYWLRTDFGEHFSATSQNSYNNLGVLLPAKVYLMGKGYEVQIGAKVQAVYTFSDTAVFQSSTIKYFFLPDLHAIYDIAGDLLRIRLDVMGSYTVNTYRGFFSRNKYLYPNQLLKDTFTPLDLRLGLVGRFSSSLVYEVLVKYTRVTDAPSFARVETPTDPSRIDLSRPYRNNNSFRSFYDDFEVYGVRSMAEYANKDGFKMGAYIEFSKYYATKYSKVYDRPELDFKFFTSYDYNSDFSFLADFRYIGERFFASIPIATESETIQSTPLIQTALSPYIDINMEIRYHMNTYFSFYIRGTNLLNKRYENWKDYPVQGAMGFLGLVIKF